jgi:hypothetical protein
MRLTTGGLTRLSANYRKGPVCRDFVTLQRPGVDTIPTLIFPLWEIPL